MEERNNLIEICEKLDSTFQKERDQWSKDYSTIIENLKSFQTAREALFSIASFRHIFLDKKTTLQSYLISLKKDYDDEFNKKWISIGVDSRDNWSWKDKEIKSSKDLSGKNQRIKILEMQSEWYKEVIKNLDKLDFTLKNLIELEKLM
jgi:hypothetical protein